MPAAAPQQMSIQQQNMLARQHVLANAIDEWNQIFQQTFNTGTLPGTIINIPIRNVGLIKRFIVQVAAIVSGSAGVTHTLTNLGVSNFLSNVIQTDL
jgi:hypothetical protein